MKKEESEFGKGLCYCLGLFLIHAGEYLEYKRNNQKIDVHLWFNAASDHLYECNVEKAPKQIRKRLNHFVNVCLKFGHGLHQAIIEDDIKWAIQEAKELLRQIDEAYDIETKEAKWG